MKNKDLKKLVDTAVALHREIAAKSERLKELKAALIQQARFHPEAQVTTEAGGTRWTAEGNDGCVARVSFPVTGILAEMEAGSEILMKTQALAGSEFRKLFTPVKVFQPVENFRVRAAAVIPAPQATELIAICEREIAPRVSFEAAKPVDNIK